METKKAIENIKRAMNEHLAVEECTICFTNDLAIILKELEKKDKRILDLEFALTDMVSQFADVSDNKINTMGLSALETAFSELNFDNPMPLEEVYEKYKKLSKQYFENKVEEAE